MSKSEKQTLLRDENGRSEWYWITRAITRPAGRPPSRIFTSDVTRAGACLSCLAKAIEPEAMMHSMEDHGKTDTRPEEGVHVAIVYHSGYGHTARQAEAVGEGVLAAGCSAPLLLSVEEAPRRWDDLNAAHAIIFGAPTYMGGASASFKTFQEATSKVMMAGGYQWRDKIAAGFTNSGARAGDKLSTLVQMVLFAAQHGMHWISLDLPPANNSTSGSEEDLNRLGFWLGAAAQSNVDEGPDRAPPEADLATARYLGARVARVTRHFVRGRALSGV